MEVYHYRNIKTALLEVENGSFHFSSSDELNDPLEGMNNVYWQGNKSDWTEFFKNYASLLFKSIFCELVRQYIAKNDRQLVKYNNQYSEGVISIITKLNYSSLLRTLNARIPKLPYVKIAIGYLSQTQHESVQIKVNKSELIWILYNIHFELYKVCNDIINSQISKYSDDLIDTNIGFHKQTKANNATFKSFIKTILDGLNQISYSSNKIQYSNYLHNGKFSLSSANFIVNFFAFYKDKSALKIETDFPQMFVDELTKLIFPESFVTCFSKDCNNSAMWGNYADSHKGVCLIYSFSNDEAILTESRSNSQITLKLQEIIYDKKIHEFNYFDALKVRENDHSMVNFSSKQNEYIQVCKEKDLIKLKEWSYEKEIRLVLTNDQILSNESNKRIYKYNYCNFKGVIFGLNTKLTDKLLIIQSLKKHENELSRDFKIYQACIDAGFQCIKKQEIDFGKPFSERLKEIDLFNDNSNNDYFDLL